MSVIDIGNLGVEGDSGSVWSMLHLKCLLDIQVDIGCASLKPGGEIRALWLINGVS